MKKFLLGAAFAALLAGSAAAQPAPPGCPTPASPGCVAIQPFVASGKATLSAGTATSNVALGSSGSLLTAVVVNTGSVDAWVAVGGSGVTATVGSGVLVPAGGWGIVAPLGTATYLAGITGSSTASLTVLTGTGVPTVNPLSSGSSGPTANVNVLNTPNVVASGNVGGFDSGPVAVSVAVNSSSHAAGTSLGGLITIPVARTSGGSGGVSSILYKSSKGSVGQVVLRLWSRNPSGTTCTDNTAFAGSSTDDAYLLTGPIPLTPQAPPVTTGDAAAYAPYFPGRLSFATNGNANIYGCAVTVATDTADESGNVIVTVGGGLN